MPQSMSNILVTGIFFLMGATANANAQSDHRCEALPTDAEKLDCYRAEVQSLNQRIEFLESGSGATVAEAEPVDPATAKKRAEDAFGAERVQQVERKQKSEKTKEEQEIDEFGEERLEKTHKKVRKTKRVELAVADISKSVRGAIIVIFENGQIWRQLNSDNTTVPLPRSLNDVTAEIKRNFFGTYLMRIKGSGRWIKVSRLK